MNKYENGDTYQASEVRRMKATYECGGLNRREFLQGLMAVGLTASVATALVTGSRDVRAETPKRGGRVRVGWNIHGPTDPWIHLSNRWSCLQPRQSAPQSFGSV